MRNPIKALFSLLENCQGRKSLELLSIGLTFLKVNLHVLIRALKTMDPVFALTRRMDCKNLDLVLTYFLCFRQIFWL